MDVTARELGLKGTAFAADTSPDSKEVWKWLDEMEDARKREKDFRKTGNRIVELYEAGKPQEYQFNILYSNTETMLPALYNTTPRPVVQRRFKDEDPLGKMAAKAAERTLEYLIDDGNSAYTAFDDLMKSAVIEALVPGRGLTRFKYDAVLEDFQNEQAAEGAESPEDEGESTGEAEAPDALPQNVKYETVCGEEIPWDRFLHGNAKKWKDVPWCAVQHFMTREELERNFGEIGTQVPVIEMVSGDADTQETTDPKSHGPDLKGLKVAEVYEIWDKEEKEVLFISPQWKSAPIKKVEDPLNLTGFYPWPKPLTFVTKISSLVPVALYAMYEEQAKELNKVTVRIGKLINALKVRGLYDATVEGIDKVLQAEDNVLIPAENVAALLSQGNALEKAIWLFPIEKLIPVLQQLYMQRQQVKTVIYEITGIADIMRGTTQASETLGAQQLKNQWGTLRLKKAQKEVMRYCRECLRIITEIAVTKLSAQTLKSMTGLPYPMQSEKQQLQMQMAQVQGQFQQAQQVAQMQGQPPPQPPQIPPQVQQTLGSPTWEDLLGLLQDDTQRNYRVDIETNSTVDAEATEDKKDIGELLNAISQFLNGVAPMIQDGTLPFGVAQGMLLAVVRRYRFGPELEDQLKQMQAPQPKDDPKAAEAQKKELEKAQQEVEAGQKKIADEQRALQQKAEDAQRNIQALQEKAQMELEASQKTAEQDIELQRRQLEHDKALAQQEIAFAKQLALKEVEFATKQREAEADQRIRTKEHGLQLKQSAHAEAVTRNAESEKAKMAEKQGTDSNGSLLKGLEKVGTSIVEGLANAKPRTARKQPDGSWTTE